MTGGYHTFTVGEVLTASNLNTYVRDQTIWNFTTTTARNTALSGATLQDGMMCFCADTAELYIRKSGVWVAARTRVVMATSDTTVTDSVTLTNASGLSFGVEANSTYLLRFDIGMISIGTTANDIQFGWTTPSGVGGNWYLGGQLAASSSDYYPEVFRGDTGWGATANFGTLSSGITFLDGRAYLTTGANSGTMQLQFAEQTATGGVTSVRVVAGSAIYIDKVA